MFDMSGVGSVRVGTTFGATCFGAAGLGVAPAFVAAAMGTAGSGAAVTGAVVAGAGCAAGSPDSGTTGAGATGADLRASEVSIVFAVVFCVASTASAIDRLTNVTARMPVARVRKFAAPRADIRPVGEPPMPSPPPSDCCIRITVIR